MSDNVTSADDFLAAQLIAKYFLEFEAGTTWNYRLWEPKYVVGDTWATQRTWLDLARRCVESGKAHIPALEVLLAEGCGEFLPSAIQLVHDWETESGHDAYYYFDLMAHFPKSDPIRRKYLGYKHPVELDENDGMGWNKARRKALLSSEDVGLCRYIAETVSRALFANPVDDETLLDYALSRMAELGRLCTKYMTSRATDEAKRFCLAHLKKDREAWRNPVAEGERSVWVRWDIAYWSWRLGWTDVLLFLEGEAWYWEAIFEDYSDSENLNLLTWSLIKQGSKLENRALHVMRSDPYHKLDGAIAWTRLRTS